MSKYRFGGFEKYVFERWNRQMTERKIFADSFSQSFTETGEFFQFLSDRKSRSQWMTAPSREAGATKLMEAVGQLAG